MPAIERAYPDREIPISRYVRDRLAKLMELQEKAGMKSGYVFATSNDTPTIPDNLLRFHMEITTRLGLPYTLSMTCGESQHIVPQYIVVVISHAFFFRSCKHTLITR